MKTTIDLPDALVEEAKIAAIKRRSTLKNLVVEGLEMVLKHNPHPATPTEVIARLHKGYHLGGKPMKRDDIHAR
ncbi:MAG: hypothetical protein O7C75_03635 [Verrucomicrobia bacterium]|nr:hypothetical protein [Verrucomicrobiota bacterium]